MFAVSQPGTIFRAILGTCDDPEAPAVRFWKHGTTMWYMVAIIAFSDFAYFEWVAYCIPFGIQCAT